MVADYPLSDLVDNKEEIKEHQLAAAQRIRAFYLDEEDPPNGFDEFEQAPHQMMLESAAEWTVMPRRSFPDVQVAGEGPRFSELEYLVLGIATERALNAIHLSENPTEFTDHMAENDGETPPYTQAQKIVVHDLASELDEGQIRRVKLVLDIMRMQRNNIAHFGFHRFSFANHFALIYQVLAFLFDRYAAGLTEEITEMCEHYEAGNRIEETYGHVEFPFGEKMD